MKKEKTYAAFFVEGKTEMVFYRLLSDYLSSQADTDQIPIVKIIDMKGENHFPQKANAKALSLFIQKHPADAYVFFFCYDHDLYPEKPPVDWEKTKKGLPKGKIEAYFLSPIEQIEDWFFLDGESLRKYLRLPSDFDLEPYRKLHASGLRRLFWRQRKVYRKGARSESLIRALSFPRLIERIGSPLEPILRLFPTGLDK